MTHPVIIVGAGLAGWTTVREFRKIDPDTPVVLVTADRGDFYAKPSLSNAFAQKRGPEQLVSTPAAKMAETLNVTLLAQTQAEAVDVAAKTLRVSHGGTSQTLHYRQLVLATGAQPIRVPVQGDAADQVHSVNSLDDFRTFHALLTQGANAVDGPPQGSRTIVIMGAGLIGCEFANDLVQAGHTVHVVDPSARPLATLLPEAAGRELALALAPLGVQWHFGSTVQAVHRTDAGLTVALSDGHRMVADAVLSAIGLRADMRLAEAAGIACERGIVVNAQLQTSAAEVFALGDCAQYATAGQRTLPYVMPVMHAAKALAATLAGVPTDVVFPLMPVSIKTPALPIVVAPPHPAQSGDWAASADGTPGHWRFLDLQGLQRGFVLTGAQTSRRLEQTRATML